MIEVPGGESTQNIIAVPGGDMNEYPRIEE